jgi:hypothetical protein
MEKLLETGSLALKIIITAAPEPLIPSMPSSLCLHKCLSLSSSDPLGSILRLNQIKTKFFFFNRRRGPNWNGVTALSAPSGPY